ncbi:MAG: CidA/LrgA family protein [Erysipelotrichaceae bacterium]|nr:CidA/LrgA family protein [Erysipelotrichaceae bacterium]
MKIFKQLLLIMAFTLVGTFISYLLGLIHFPFPGSLIGMILLFVFLLFGLVKVDSIHDVGQFFIDNMGIFFVPASIAILKQVELISTIWWKLLIIIFGAFLISFTATYYSVKLTLYLQHRHQQKKEQANTEVEHD